MGAPSPGGCSPLLMVQPVQTAHEIDVLINPSPLREVLGTRRDGPEERQDLLDGELVRLLALARAEVLK